MSSLRTGAIVRRLLPADRGGMSVQGLSIDRYGNLWITYTKGPSGPVGFAGLVRPHSCANEIAVLHASTGRLSVFLRTGGYVQISGAAVSPDGRLVSYSETGCTTGHQYVTGPVYLRVADVRSGHSWTIGRTARCYWMTDPAWSSDGRALFVGYASNLGRPSASSRGDCTGVGAPRLVELKPTAQPGLHGRSVDAGRGCDILSVAGTAAGGMLAVERCGLGRPVGPGRLLVFGAHLHQVWQAMLARCADGVEVSSGRSGQSALITEIVFCNPPGKPGPATRLWSYTGGKLRLITSVPGGGMTVSQMTW